MRYYEVNFTIEPYLEDYADVFSALLAEIGFESFIPTDKGLTAYIQQNMFDARKMSQTIENFPIQ